MRLRAEAGPSLDLLAVFSLFSLFFPGLEPPARIGHY